MNRPAFSASRDLAAGPRPSRAKAPTAFRPGLDSLEGRVLLRSGTTFTFNPTPNPAAFGQAVTLNVTLTSTNPLSFNAPSGTLTFEYNGAPLGTANLTAGSGGTEEFATASLTNVTSLPIGTDTITVTYPGDGNYDANTGSFTETVNVASTTTTVTASAAPSVYGQPVTFTAAVSSTGGTPTGTVTFKDGSTTLGTRTLASGSASFTTSSPLAVGNHTITAVYAATSAFSGSTGTLAGGEVVNKASTTTTIQTPIPPTTLGQPEQITATVVPVAPGSGTIGGSVNFKAVSFTNVTYNLGSVAVGSGGTAALTSAVVLPAGTYTVTAYYLGDANFLTSTSASASETINGASSTTTVTASPATSVYGQAVTFTAGVTSTGGTPTGTVTFKDGSTTLGTGTLSGGTATFTTSSPLAVGNHAITAVYAGTTAFGTSTGTLAGGYTVNKASTSTTVQSPTATTVYGQAESLSATVSVVAPGSGSPGGTVDFKAVSPGNVTYDLGSSPVVGGATATLTSTVVLPAGTYTVKAYYSGDTNFNASTSAGASETVGQASTTTAVASTASTVVYPNPVTFTATVGAVSPGSGTPGGTVSFSVDGGAGVSVPLSGGTAGYTPSSPLAPGHHTVSVTYNGSPNFRTSTGTLNGGLNVTSAPTTTTLSVSPGNSIPYSAPVTLTATVASVPGVTPTGMVTFYLDNSSIGTAALSGGTTHVTVPSILQLGGHTVSASYGGDAYDLASASGNKSVTVVPDASRVTLAASVQPVPDHGSVFYTATVSPAAPGTATPGGTLQFFLDNQALGSSIALVNGRATSLTVSGLAYRGHTVTASYTPDSSGHFLASDGKLAGGSVFQASTTTAMSAPAATTYGVPTVLTATVAAVPGEVTPTPPGGTVVFYYDGKAVGSAAVLNGIGTLTETTIPAGSHTLTARFVGNLHWAASTSTTGSAINVAPASTSTSPVSVTIGGRAVTSTTYGTSVTLSATVANISSAPAPVGAVRFYDNSVAPAKLLGVAALVGNTATLSTNPTVLSGSPSHHIVAVYAGTLNFATSTSPVATGLNVRPASTSIFGLTESATTLVYGQPMTLSVQVSNTSGTGVAPAGVVRFYNNAVSPAKLIGSAAVINGVATLPANPANPLRLVPGAYHITASFVANANFTASGPSNAVDATVSMAASSTSLTSSVSGPIAQGTPVTYIATVADASGTGVLPTGPVTFYRDFNPTTGVGTVVGRVYLVGGVATLAGAIVPLGTHTMTAVYGGSVGFLGSRSTTLTQVVHS